jgi:hypothetical protein
MGEPSRATMADNEHYQELASKLRGIARQSRSPSTQQKILKLASWYEARAKHLDTRSPPEGFAQDPR